MKCITFRCTRQEARRTSSLAWYSHKQLQIGKRRRGQLCDESRPGPRREDSWTHCCREFDARDCNAA